MGTALVVWLLVVVIASAAWEVRRMFLADADVTSSAWQERHRLLREQLEHHPSSKRQEQFEHRLAQAALHAKEHHLPPEEFLDAATACEVRVWQQQQTLAQDQTYNDYQQRVRHTAND